MFRIIISMKLSLECTALPLKVGDTGCAAGKVLKL